MGSVTRWTALLAVVAGVWAAAASAGDSPLAPKSLRLALQGDGAAISYDGNRWETTIAGYDQYGLDLLQPTYVRGPARILVTAGTFIELAKGDVVVLTWEPAVRGYRVVALVGSPTAQFANVAVRMPQGTSITFTSGGDIYRAPSGYASNGVIGLSGLPEVSGFRPFVDDPR